MTKTKAAADEEIEKFIEFDRRLNGLARCPPLTLALVTLNVVVWIVTVACGVNWLDPSGDSLRAWGANYGPLTSHGDGWRLVTSCFLHLGLAQLLVNQWALWQFGSWLERFFGHVGLGLLYLTTGFASSVLAVRWQPDMALAGSTGASAGLIGAMIAFLIRVPGVVPTRALTRLRAPTFVFLGYNVGVALYRQRLDAAGFLGGLVAGFVSGLILSQPLGAEGRPPRLPRNSLLAAAGIVLALFAPLLVRPDPVVEFQQIRAAKLEVLANFQTALDDLKKDRIDAKQFIHIIGTQVLAPWRQLENRVDDLDRRGLPGPAGELVKLTLTSMKLREQGWNLFVDSLVAGSEEGQQNAADRIAEAEKIEDEIDATAERAAAK